jgi:hypothetical protein
LSGNSDAGGEDIQTQDDNTSGYHMNDEDGDEDFSDEELWDAESDHDRHEYHPRHGRRDITSEIFHYLNVLPHNIETHLI